MRCCPWHTCSWAGAEAGRELAEKSVSHVSRLSPWPMSKQVVVLAYELTVLQLFLCSEQTCFRPLMAIRRLAPGGG